MASFFDVVLINKVIMVSIILLPNFIVQNLKSFSMLCLEYKYIETKDVSDIKKASKQVNESKHGLVWGLKTEMETISHET